LVTRVILVRHGETQANRERRFIGRYNDVLTEVGQVQAGQLADSLALLPVAALYTSPLQRASDTARPIAARHGLDVQVEDALRECDFGLWDGLNRAEIVARSPGDAQLFAAWQRDTTITPPGGESIYAMHMRVSAALEHLRRAHLDQTIVLVSHVGPIKTLLCEALAMPTSSLFRFFLDLASISMIDWPTSFPVVRLINGRASWEVRPDMFIPL
jgi:broad specificity phosphatase PhoE